jgi:acyl-CoA reductase-like NAD-dependent aldehyde dehydrogenase
VESPVADRFLELLADKAAKLTLGDPRDPNTLIGPMITRSQYETARGFQKTAPGEGARIVFGGGTPDLPDPFAGGLWIEPTCLAGVKPGMRVHDEEIFGPVLSAVTFASEAEAVRISNSVAYGLSGSVWTASAERALRMVRALDTGLVWVNTMLTGYPQIPVPPHKMSGTGVELGMEGMLAYCKRKSAMLGYDPAAPVGWGL